MTVATNEIFMQPVFGDVEHLARLMLLYDREERADMGDVIISCARRGYAYRVAKGARSPDFGDGSLALAVQLFARRSGVELPSNRPLVDEEYLDCYITALEVIREALKDLRD